ncbi:hypothetical protein WGC32_13745 [Zongyangia sp. HA2173]|uniref:hypothetical protein n=1 Tax=Zongyangia sp. HA2173 TaxID=3133035 RepID=UPI0031676E0C
MNKALFELEHLTVEADGLASMAMALHEAFAVGRNAPETYFDAVRYYACLLCDFRDKLNEAVKSVWRANNTQDNFFEQEA